MENQRGGCRVITEAEWRNLQRMREALWSHPLLADGELLKGQAEVSVFRHWTTGRTVLRKARIDCVHEGPSLLDLKSTEDARPEAFHRKYCERGYYRQGAYYLDLWNDSCRAGAEVHWREPKTHFVILSVEKAPPYGVVVYAADPASLDKGRAEYRECVDKDEWPCYPTAAQSLNLPPWAYQNRGPWDPLTGGELWV